MFNMILHFLNLRSQCGKPATMLAPVPHFPVDRTGIGLLLSHHGILFFFSPPNFSYFPFSYGSVTFR